MIVLVGSRQNRLGYILAAEVRQCSSSPKLRVLAFEQYKRTHTHTEKHACNRFILYGSFSSLAEYVPFY